jgi:hypothetical protein
MRCIEKRPYQDDRQRLSTPWAWWWTINIISQTSHADEKQGGRARLIKSCLVRAEQYETSYLYYSLLFSMYDASGGCGHHRDVHSWWRVEEARFEFWRWREVGCLVDIFFLPPSCCRNHHHLSLGVAVAIVNDRAEWSSTHSIESLIQSRVALFSGLSWKAKGRPQNQPFVTRAPHPAPPFSLSASDRLLDQRATPNTYAN